MYSVPQCMPSCHLTLTIFRCTSKLTDVSLLHVCLSIYC